MPKITEIKYGITIHIYNGDHLPAHFHALCNGLQLRYDMENFKIIDNELGIKETKAVIDFWNELANETKNGFINFFYSQNPNLRK